MKSTEKRKKRVRQGLPVYLLCLSLIILVLGIGKNSWSQEKGEGRKVQAFIDENGDGFNDLLPDSDGDGIPDLIDPDYRGHSAESLYMKRYDKGSAMEIERNQFRQAHQHGEPGQYGPHDSTGHGSRGGQGGSPGGPGMGGDYHSGGSGSGPGEGHNQGEGDNPAPPDIGQMEKSATLETDVKGASQQDNSPGMVNPEPERPSQGKRP